MRVNRQRKTMKREELYQRFGKAIAHYRVAVDLTQAELATKIKRPRSYVNNVEGGWQRVYLADVFTLAKALGLDPTVFINEIAHGVTYEDKKG